MTRSKPKPDVETELLAHDETRLMDGKVICLQPQHGYRTAIDPVLLAAAIDAKTGDRVLDVGSGTGAASLCLAARVHGLQITGLELQPDYAALARQSAELNGWSDHINFVTADLAETSASGEFREFDHVMTNPPYVEQGRGRASPDPRKALATAESRLGLHEWLRTCVRMTKSRGTVTVIHRGDRLEHIVAALTGAVGELIIYPFWPTNAANSSGKDCIANRVIVTGRKSVNSPGKLSRGLTIHSNDTGEYTPETMSILTGRSSLRDFI